MGVARHWNRLARELVETLPLEVFRVRLDEALSTLGKLKVSLPRAGGLNWMICSTLGGENPWPMVTFTAEINIKIKLCSFLAPVQDVLGR